MEIDGNRKLLVVGYKFEIKNDSRLNKELQDYYKNQGYKGEKLRKRVVKDKEYQRLLKEKEVLNAIISLKQLARQIPELQPRIEMIIGYLEKMT